MKSTIIKSAAVALIALATVISVAAQGRYTGKYSKRDVSNIIKNVENSSNSFRNEFDKQMDRSNLNGTPEEDRANRIVANFENALDRLRRQFDMTDTWWQTRNNVENVMDEASKVNYMMNSLAFARKLERQWSNLRKDVNKLADTYDLQPLYDGGTGGGNVPSWAIGAFTARNPQNGGRITMTISADGRVAIDFDGQAQNFATMRGDQLVNQGVVSRVSQIPNGIRTTRLDNGERLDYVSNYNGGWNNGNNGGWNNGNVTGGNVPNWAVGTFSGQNPQSGGRIVLNITTQGNVNIVIDGRTVGQAVMNGDQLYNNGVVSRVTRIRNGIRTTRTDNGEAIDYYYDYGNGVGNVSGGNVPNWAIGRFYGRNPENGGRITLDINSNGEVTITFDNNVSVYATMNGDRLYNNGVISRVTKTRNGIRTTRTDNGEAIDYRK